MAANPNEDFAGYMDNIAEMEAEERAEQEMFRAHEVCIIFRCCLLVSVIWGYMTFDFSCSVFSFAVIDLTHSLTHSIPRFNRNGNKQHGLDIVYYK